MRETGYVMSRRQLLLRSAVAATLGTAFVQASRSVAQETIAGRDLLKDKRPVIHSDGPKLGCYDPYGDFSNETQVATEHLFLPWEDVELEGLGVADEYASARGRKILITIEPWSWAKDWNVSPRELRDSILSGQRDANMRAVLKAVASFKSPVFIRWAQEMENPTGRFTWANWAPKDYITAYKRMIDIVRDMLPRAQIVWSPKGLKGLEKYYPGDDYLDVVGLSVFGYDRFDKIEYGKELTFAEAVQPGYDLTVGFGKPIWVAELGYEGELDYLQRWVMDVTANLPQFPELKEVIYFNDREVWEWPHGLGLPNWRVLREQPIYPVRR